MLLQNDVKVMYPLLLQVYLHLNFVKTTIEPTTLEDDDCFCCDAIKSSLENEL